MDHPADQWLLPTERLPDTPEGVARAAALLRQGMLVGFATETVYGLGADARSDTAVARVFAAKGRPARNPLIVHVADVAAAQRIAVFPAAASRLAAQFWPGPLTLVLPQRAGSGVSALVTAGLSTVAIRIPAHPLALALLRAFGGPVAAPSANPSGRVSPTSADHVMGSLAGRIAAVLDGGPCAVGIESTIVGFAVAHARGAVLLRPGGIAAEVLADCLGQWPSDCNDGGDHAPTAPGQFLSHYATRAVLRLDAAQPHPGEVWLGFGPGGAAAALNLSPTGDLAEAAANLFAHLRRLDACAGQSGTIAVAPIPERGVGRAINDRLRRAAAPRL